MERSELTHVLDAISGFLDIEKLVEHSPFGAPGIPQRELATASFYPPDGFVSNRMHKVRFAGLDSHGAPIFSPLNCGHCSQTITGSMYIRNGSSIQRRGAGCICERCYFSIRAANTATLSNRHSNDVPLYTDYTKRYRHCPIHSISPGLSREMCRCRNVSAFTTTGRLRPLLPITKADLPLHIGSANPTTNLQCTLLRLPFTVAMAKYRGVHALAHVTPEATQKQQVAQEQYANNVAFENNGGSTKKRFWRLKSTRSKAAASDAQTPVLAEAYVNISTDPRMDGDIPLFWRQMATDDPFGGVHTALRFGPVVIRNNNSVYVQTFLL